MHESVQQLKQRADYTHKFNANTGRHGWLRLTPAYSVKVVEEILDEHHPSDNVLDPFCGTGTTALSAAHRGHRVTTIDINPFLVWLARLKTAHYSAATLGEVEEAGDAALDLAQRETIIPAPEPPIHNIQRWWAEPARRFLCHLKAAIRHVTAEASAEAALLYVAFCRTLIHLSNAAFNHQSMSFKDNAQYTLGITPGADAVFAGNLKFILHSAAVNPAGEAAVAQGDARELTACLQTKFDLVVTSPPYANRMSYIRELRPYMYWLDFLTDCRGAGDLDWLAVGGTWGIATSRLAEWRADGNHWTPGNLQPLLESIAGDDNKNGALLANYVAKYCEDMSRHFAGLSNILTPGARIHYIVGNSTFYGVLVPIEQIYADIMRYYDFTDIEVRPIRKRNSKKELVEFDVSATWRG